MSTHASHILIVEDDDVLRGALIDTAEVAGFDVSGANDGESALDGFEGRWRGGGWLHGS